MPNETSHSKCRKGGGVCFIISFLIRTLFTFLCKLKMNNDIKWVILREIMKLINSLSGKTFIMESSVEVSLLRLCCLAFFLLFLQLLVDAKQKIPLDMKV